MNPSIHFHVAAPPSLARDLLWPVLVLVAACLTPVANSPATRVVLAISAIYCLARASSSVLSEALVALPDLGLQIEVRRGTRLLGHAWHLSTERRFLPKDHVKDIVIHEALHRWNVRFFLAVLTQHPDNPAHAAIHLVFKNTLPPFPVLRECHATIRDHV